MTVQGIPRNRLADAGLFLAPLRLARNERTRRMTAAVSSALSEAGFESIDFERDVADKSQYIDAETAADAQNSGGITERHLLAAAAGKIISKCGKASALTAALTNKLDVDVPPKIAALLADPANPHYLYDLLGLLKAQFLPRFFIQPGEAECVPARKVVDFALQIGAVPAYAYLGDVAESPTGDKKAEKFEDAYLDGLFDELERLGYKAVTYMPPRNTQAQLERVQRLCERKGFLQISGVDINSSRQSFDCPQVLLPAFRHLVGTTWALIMHERAAALDQRNAFFSAQNPLAALTCEKRAASYAAAARELDLRQFSNEQDIVSKLMNGGFST
jgi:hypothetical protein